MKTQQSVQRKLTPSIDNGQEDKIVKNNKKCKKYFMIEGQTKVYFNADFDSGNLQNVEQLSPYVYKLYPGFDKVKMSTQKTYFHFKVFGFQMCLVRFHITRVAILQKLLRKGQQSVYKPVVRKGKGDYKTIQKRVQIYYNKLGEAQLSIEYEFNEEDQWTEFAFSYPYSYQDMTSLVKQLKVKFIDHSDIYFHEETLAYTKQGRKLQLITITEKRNCLKQRQTKLQNLFPDCDNTNQRLGSKRPFKINKPKVIISGRVHPGQTPASYCVQGLLRFLLDQKDYRSYLLRKNFHFIIVPMLNPDGVYHGMFRNDLNGQNLNRLYVKCSKSKHPTIWSFRQYLKSLQQSQQPVMFYFDFHAHPSKKQFFIYGNAFNQFTHQVEAETFGKLLQNNCPYFHNIDSIFTQKQMGAKDKHDEHTKEGCGRVFNHKLFGIIHSYTVQCGYFAPQKVKKWEESDIIQKQSQILSNQYAYVPTWQKYSTNAYTPQSYMFMGKTILITILDLFHLNPYTRINTGQFKSIGNIRKNVGAKIYNAVERFRLIDSNVPKKLKELNKIIQADYYKIKVGNYGLSISENYGMKRPNRRFSLNSRVYLSKLQLNNKMKSLEKQQKNQQDLEHVQLNTNINEQQEQSQSSQREEQFYKSTQFDKRLLHQILINKQSTFQQIKQHIQLKLKTHNLNKQQKQINGKQYDHSHSSPNINFVPNCYIRLKESLKLPTKKQIKDQKDTQFTMQKRQIVIDKDLSRTKRVSSQVSIANKCQYNKKSNGLTTMIQQIQQNISASIMSEKVETRFESYQKNIKTNKKQTKIDLFLKKQQACITKTKNDKVSDLQKYVTEKMNQQTKKNMMLQTKSKFKNPFQISSPPILTSRFPNLKLKQIQHNMKTNSQKFLKAPLQ